MKRCMYEPIPEVFRAAEILARAALAHTADAREHAAELLVEANMPAIIAWQKPDHLRPFEMLESEPPIVPTEERPFPRMPSAATRRQVIERDGHHCRFCGMPVIASEIRKAIARSYGDSVLPWGTTFETCHAAFQCLWLQFDHILPNVRGGTSDLDNIVITCAPCNYGRMNFTLSEVGVCDPLSLPPPIRWSGHSDWNGLRAFLADNHDVLSNKPASVG